MTMRVTGGEGRGRTGGGDVFNLDCVSVGDLLNKEISKKSEFGKAIVDQRRTYSYVSDAIVIDLVKKQIEALEAEQKSWIIEGFPRTRVSCRASPRSSKR